MDKTVHYKSFFSKKLNKNSWNNNKKTVLKTIKKVDFLLYLQKSKKVDLNILYT